MTKNRIPKDFFIFEGAGDSPLELHAGSYHMALNEAKISDFNIISYSSVLPKTANEITYEYAINEHMIPEFGSELMCIMSHAHGIKGDKIIAGLCFGWLRDKLGNKIGGLVTECTDKNISKQNMIDHLYKVIDDLHIKTYSQYSLTEVKVLTKEHLVNDKFGSAIIGLAFLTFN
jgi:arginine decarboxylase